ncbi:hypothetical protein JTE90_028405 [Oedothorax gibbosus]|uniref:Uncharacterized protein n=1 Tax=Oedothorax gibbosus TaxID=931172 RepID=A0AAV6VF76_9ARAC|nr:hypothetical protein JTE90_028405 [Oedothorax gibbosus]
MSHRAGLILCLTAVLVSAEIGCPYPEDIEPCTCRMEETKDVPQYTTLTCSKVHDTEVLLRVFENSRRYTYNSFDLMESSLQYIPHQIFDDVVVHELFMVNVTLRNLFDEVPRDPGIWWLEAQGVKVLGGLDWKQLTVFKNLERIVMRDVPLKKLTADFRSNVSKKLRSCTARIAKLSSWKTTRLLNSLT